MIAEIFNFLNQYTAISREDFEVLMGKLELRNYGKKVKLTDIGEVENRMHFIMKGLTRKFFYRDNDEVITQIIQEGHLISSTASFFSRQPSTYIVEALEPTTTYSITFDDLESLYAAENKWENFGRVITTNFLLVQERLLMDNIRLSVKDRFKAFMLENPDLLQRVPQKQLASYLNIKQETFSRMKHLMYDKKLQTI
jgi:CRP-like cAMP-binding protein